MSIYTRIINKRKKLNFAIEKYGLDSQETRDLSIEIDNLINIYYKRERIYVEGNKMHEFYLYSLKILQESYKQTKEFPSIEMWNKIAKANYCMTSESLKYISGLNWHKLEDRLKLKN